MIRIFKPQELIIYINIIIYMYIYDGRAGFVRTSVSQLRVMRKTFVTHINVKTKSLSRVFTETAHPIILIISFKRKITSWNRF